MVSSKGFLTVLFLLALTSTLSPIQQRGVESFEKHFGANGMDRGIAVQQLANGDFVVVGYSTSFGSGDEDVYLVRADSVGNQLWSRTFGGPGRDDGWDVLALPDGGFTLVGFSNSAGDGDFDIHLLRVDGGGNLLWEKRHGTEGDEYGWSGALLRDGGFVVAGETGPKGVYGEGDRDFYLTRTDSLGRQLWEQSFGGLRTDRAYSVGVAPDGGFLLYGSTNSRGAGGWDAYLVRTDANGNLEWEKTYGAGGFDMGHDVHVCTDGGLLLTGYTASFGAAAQDGWLIRTDSNGNELWRETVGGAGDDRLVRGLQTQDGGYAAAGYTQSFGSGGWDSFLVRVDDQGKTIWTRAFGAERTETAYGIAESADGGIVITGWAGTNGTGDFDMVLIKTPGAGG